MSIVSGSFRLFRCRALLITNNLKPVNNYFSSPVEPTSHRHFTELFLAIPT